MEKRDRALERAIEFAGGPAELARFIKSLPGQEPITAQAICDWKRCPPLRVLAVEKAAGLDAMDRPRVSRHELRPDLYPEETRPHERADVLERHAADLRARLRTRTYTGSCTWEAVASSRSRSSPG